jgi:hypothetical protein
MLQDLVPEETSFKLHKTGNKQHAICAFSLRVRIWIQKKYSNEAFKEILEKQKTAEIAELVYFMLKDKTDFPTLDDFYDAIRTPVDTLEIFKCVLHSMGISDDRAAELAKESENPKAKAPSQIA